MDLAALDALEERLADVCGHRNALDAQLVAVAAEALEHGLWQGEGIVSPSHWLAWKAGLSPSHARQVIAVAARRAELPVTFAAFERGELSIDQVAPIVAKAPAYTDAEMCAFATQATVTQIDRVVRSYAFEPDPRPEEDHSPDVADRRAEHLSWSLGDDGRWRLHGELDADHGATFDSAMREALDALFAAGNPRPTNVEALVELADRSLDSITDHARRDRYRIHVHVDAGGEVTDRLGAHAPRWWADSLWCDALVTPVFEVDGIPVSIGRSQRIVPERTRRLVLLRDRGCRVPGCTQERVLHVHHIIHWDPDDGGGPTDTWNLLAICPRHHRMHHRGELGITGNADRPDGIVFTDHRGRVLPCGGVARPPNGPPPPPQGRCRQPDRRAPRPPLDLLRPTSVLRLRSRS